MRLARVSSLRNTRCCRNHNNHRNKISFLHSHPLVILSISPVTRRQIRFIQTNPEKTTPQQQHNNNIQQPPKQQQSHSQPPPHHDQQKIAFKLPKAVADRDQRLIQAFQTVAVRKSASLLESFFNASSASGFSNSPILYYAMCNAMEAIDREKAMKYFEDAKARRLLSNDLILWYISAQQSVTEAIKVGEWALAQGGVKESSTPGEIKSTLLTLGSVYQQVLEVAIKTKDYAKGIELVVAWEKNPELQFAGSLWEKAVELLFAMNSPKEKIVEWLQHTTSKNPILSQPFLEKLLINANNNKYIGDILPILFGSRVPLKEIIERIRLFSEKELSIPMVDYFIAHINSGASFPPIMLSYIIQGALQDLLVDRAFKVFQYAKQHKLFLVKRSVEFLVCELAFAHKFSQAIEVFNYMIDNNIIGNIFLYNTLIQHVGAAHPEFVTKVLERMISIEMYPRKQTYLLLMTVCRLQYNADDAMELWKLVKEKYPDIYADTVAMNNIISTLARVGHVQEAITVYTNFRQTGQCLQPAVLKTLNTEAFKAGLKPTLNLVLQDDPVYIQYFAKNNKF